MGAMGGAPGSFQMPGGGAAQLPGVEGGAGAGAGAGANPFAGMGGMGGLGGMDPAMI
jgi:hypothetical protein